MLARLARYSGRVYCRAGVTYLKYPYLSMMMMMMMMMKILSLTERHNLELTMERKLWKKNVGTLLAVDEQ